MTDTTTAGLEKRLRRPVDGENGHSGDLWELMIEAADALAKARVALESVQWIPDGPSGNLSCSACGAGKPGHNPRCPIGAALEAMK